MNSDIEREYVAVGVYFLPMYIHLHVYLCTHVFEIVMFSEKLRIIVTLVLVAKLFICDAYVLLCNVAWLSMREYQGVGPWLTERDKNPWVKESMISI